MSLYFPSADCLLADIDEVDGSKVKFVKVNDPGDYLAVLVRLEDGRCYCFQPTDAVPVSNPTVMGDDREQRVPVDLSRHYLGSVQVGAYAAKRSAAA